MLRTAFSYFTLPSLIWLSSMAATACGQADADQADADQAQQLRALIEAQARSNPFSSRVEGYPKKSAFAAIKWRGMQPWVEIDGQWYELLALQGLRVEEIQRKCADESWPFKIRFAEDHARLLQLLGQELDDTTFLTVRDASGRTQELQDVPFTEAKRNKLRVIMSRDAAMSDLNVFHARLKEQFAYLETNGVDLDAAIGKIRSNIGKENDPIWLTQELKLIMAQFIDGHAGVSGPTNRWPGYLPFLIVPSGDRFVAVKADRSALLDTNHAYIESIDGVAVRSYWKSPAVTWPAGPPSIENATHYDSCEILAS